MSYSGNTPVITSSGVRHPGNHPYQKTKMDAKLFIIGMNKTATRSLHRLFEASGYASVHWDKGRLARRIETNIRNGVDPISGYESYRVFSDMEDVYSGALVEAYRHFREIYKYHPEALFLLNYRDVDDWLRSRKRHVSKNDYQKYLRHYKIHLKTNCDEEVMRYWRRSYFAHISDVLDFFSDKPQSLLFFNLDRDTVQDLAEQLEPMFRVDAEHWSHIGRTDDPGPEPKRSFMRQFTERLRSRS